MSYENDDVSHKQENGYRVHFTSRPNNNSSSSAHTALLTISPTIPSSSSMHSSPPRASRASLLVCGCLTSVSTLILLLLILQVSPSARSLFMPFVSTDSTLTDYLPPTILFHAQTLGFVSTEDDNQTTSSEYVQKTYAYTHQRYTKGQGQKTTSTNTRNNKTNRNNNETPTNQAGKMVSGPSLPPAPKFTVQEWDSMSSTIDFFLDHGIDTGFGPFLPRLRVVTRDTVAILRSVVENNHLTQNADNTLIVGVVNLGYLDFALNWICFNERLGITNYLLAAADAWSYNELLELGYGNHIILLETLADAGRRELIHKCGGGNTHAFQSYCFNVHTQMKTLLVLTSLLAGYHTVLSDMDISLIHHPFYYMPLSHYWEMQLETNQWCTGWYYNQANAFTIRMQAQVLYGIIYTPGLDDQNLYNFWIHYHRLLAPELMYKQLFPLPAPLFPIGRIYMEEKVGVLMHNNWLYTADEKRVRQKARGLYIYNRTLTEEKKQQYNNTHTRSKTVLERLLVCDVCIACQDINPYLPPLRVKWPGPMNTTDLAPYRGSDQGHA